MFRIILNKASVILLLVMITVSCSSSVKADENTKMVYKILKCIKLKQYQDLLSMYNPDKRPGNEEEFRAYIDLGAEFIDKFGIPKESDLIRKDVGDVSFFECEFPRVSDTSHGGLPQRVIDIYFDKKTCKLSKLLIVDVTSVDSSVKEIKKEQYAMYPFLTKLVFNDSFLYSILLNYRKKESKKSFIGVEELSQWATFDELRTDTKADITNLLKIISKMKIINRHKDLEYMSTDSEKASFVFTWYDEVSSYHNELQFDYDFRDHVIIIRETINTYYMEKDPRFDAEVRKIVTKIHEQFKQ